MHQAGAQIDLDKLQLVIVNQRIDCRTRDDRPLYARVVVESDIRVPGDHEMIVPCNLASDWGKAKLGLLEPIDQGMFSQSSILVARGLVSTGNVTVHVKAMKVGREDRLLKRGTVC